MSQTAALDIKTVEEQVFHLLRNEIVQGFLAPDTPLRLEEISRRIGVSTTPVRGALRRLEAEHLVRSLPHRGAIVASIEIDDLREIQSIRAALEGYASRIGAERISKREIAEMEDLEHLSEAAASGDNLDAYLEHQWRLHDICYKASRCTRLLGLIATYRLQAERYIRLAIAASDGFPGSVEHQRRLLDACRAGDGLLAERAVHEALNWTVDRLAKVLERVEVEPISSGALSDRRAWRRS